MIEKDPTERIEVTSSSMRIMNTIRGICWRIYGDFVMPSRMDNYRNLLASAQMEGYRICSISQFWDLVSNGKPLEKHLVLRHDIDSDVPTAKEMFKLEKKFGVCSSYFFRLSTVDIEFMREIESAGSEASYHYEEVATFAKRGRLRLREDVMCQMRSIRDEFSRNLVRLRQATGLSMRVVASHGDFVNRELGVFNWEILQDEALRQRLNVQIEVYDRSFMQYVQSRHSDTSYPFYWKPRSPLTAISEGCTIIYVLVHPKHWRTNWTENFHGMVNRYFEGISYHGGVAKRGATQRR